MWLCPLRERSRPHNARRTTLRKRRRGLLETPLLQQKRPSRPSVLMSTGAPPAVACAAERSPCNEGVTCVINVAAQCATSVGYVKKLELSEVNFASNAKVALLLHPPPLRCSTPSKAATSQLRSRQTNCTSQLQCSRSNIIMLGQRTPCVSIFP
jgi:hypothetical protein